MSKYIKTEDVRTLGQKIREYLLRKKFYFKAKLDWRFSILNPKYRKHCKLEKICDSLTNKYKWIEEIGHHYFPTNDNISAEWEMFGPTATTITIKDDCYDFDYGDQQDFQKEFISLIEKNRLSDCVEEGFEYLRFNHDSVGYDYE